MKPDLSVYQNLDDTTVFYVWYGDLCITMRATQLGILLEDVTYPDDPDWVNRNNWFYFVLRNKVKTVEGISIVRRYRDNAMQLKDLIITTLVR